MNLESAMDEIAESLNSISGLRAVAWPVTNVVPPSAVVLFPSIYTYDETYQRGMDRMSIPVMVMVGRTTERTSRSQLARYLNGSGSDSIKAVVESGEYTAFDSVRVAKVDIDVYTMNGTDYWGAVFELDVLGSGS